MAHYLPAIEGTDPTDHYLVLLDGRPVGMLQTYLVADYPAYAELIGSATPLRPEPTSSSATRT